MWCHAKSSMGIKPTSAERARVNLKFQGGR